MKAPLPKLKKTAIEAALAAGSILAKHFGKKLRIREKPGAGLVSNADLEAEDRSVRILKKAFPEFGFLTEENAPKITQSPGRWIIDPLDGTTNFVHGFPMFCVSIAAEWNGILQVGVIYHPILKELYVGVKDQGATLNGRKIKVSPTAQLRGALLSTGFTYRQEDWLKAEMKIFEKLSAHVRAVRRPGSAALDLAYTARGVFDGFWEQRLSPWDVAAGVVLVREAGGRVTGFDGGPLDLNAQKLVASNGLLHSAILKEILDTDRLRS